jgi:pilus assembly protein CpaE
MYPLRALLLNCDDTVLLDVQRVLVQQSLQVEGMYPDCASFLNQPREGRPEKRLLIVQLKTPAELEEIEKLNNQFQGWPILLLVAADCAAATLIRAARAGAAQFVPLPATAEDIREALARIGKQFGFASGTGTVIAVTGVVEGAGATSLAINLAWEISQHAKLPCILAELTLGMGRLALYLNLQPRFTTQHLFADPERVNMELVRQTLLAVNDKLSVLSGPYDALMALTTTPQTLVRLITLLKQLASVVVLDLPFTYDELFYQTLTATQHVVLVGNQNLPAIHALSLITLALKRREGIGKVHHVINQFNPKLSSLALHNLEKVLGTAHLHTIAADAPGFARAINDGVPLRKANPESKALADINALALQLTEGANLPEQSSSFFSRVMHWLGRK